MLTFDLSVYNERQIKSAPPSQQRRVETREADKFETIAVLAQPGSPTDKVFVQTRDGSKSDGYASGEVAINDSQGEATFQYVILWGGHSWAKGSWTDFEQIGGGAVSISKALANDEVASVVRSAKEGVVCLGLASSEPPGRGYNNEQYADERAQSLCLELAKLGYIDPKVKSVRGIALGAAQNPESSASGLSRQRAAIIVSITDSYKILNLDVYLASVFEVARKKVRNLDLEQYSAVHRATVHTLTNLPAPGTLNPAIQSIWSIGSIDAAPGWKPATNPSALGAVTPK